MLTIAKLRGGLEDYYLNSVATGIEDYYAGHGEAPGRWRGAAAGRLGLDGDVDGDVLRSLLTGQLPGAAEPVGKHSNRTPGWDLTWSAPKSVSVVFGLGDAAASGEAVAAHEKAVDEGLAYLDRWALVSRRRIGGEVTPVEGQGMVVAGFRHRTSRAMDPQLHTHTLVANVVERADGTWGAIDSRVLYRHAKTAGYVYQAVLRAEMTRRLGVEWGAVRNGTAELAGVPAGIRDVFATRRAEIEAELEASGHTSAKAAQVAAVRTRAVKGPAAGTDVLREGWRERAAEYGFTVADLEAGFGAVSVGEQWQQVSVRQRRLGVDVLVGEDGLTEKRASFNRGDIVRGWCEQIDTRTVDVSAAGIDDLVEQTVGDRRSVELGQADTRHGVAERRRWSTVELLTLEERIMATVLEGRNQDVATVQAHKSAAAIAGRPSLSGEQAAMITELTTGGHRIDAVVGVAGAGKTYALSIARDLWVDAGYRVVGAAVAAKAARQLEADSGIVSSTLDRMLLDLSRPESGGLPAGTVVVLDEAGMVPTRKLGELLTHCGPDVKVVLVGDHRQLPEIDAGGVLRAVAERFGDRIPTLTENRRQQDLGERAALAQVRDGDVADGIGWYEQHGRIHTTNDAAAAREAIIQAWWADRQAGCVDQLLMAERRVDVARLNRAARAMMGTVGALAADPLEVGEREFAVGDTVLFGRNDNFVHVSNGERGTVTAINRDERSLTVEIGSGRTVTVDSEYLDNGHLDWGYAATVHKNQGATCDRAYLMASDAIYRELGYVALSRGRIANRVWVVEELDIDDDVEPHGQEPPQAREPVRELINAMQRSAAQQLAIDEAADLNRENGFDID